MSEKDKQIGDQILDLLLDALLERQRERDAETAAGKQEAAKERPREPRAVPPPSKGVPVPEEPKVDVPETDVLEPERRPTPAAVEESEMPFAETIPPMGKPELVDDFSSRIPLPGAELGYMLSRLFLALIVLVVLINIPYNRFGTSLARAMPDSAALIIRDGLLLKGSGEKVYVLEDNQRRWITTLDAFEEYGYSWDNVHVVEDAFLEKFEEGLPIHLLLKCQSSPHIYALEDGKKRWIKDIPTFEAREYVWEDVRFIDCGRLRNLPDGPPIPEDAGPPPQP